MNKLILPSILFFLLVACSDAETRSVDKKGDLQMLATPADSVSAEPFLFTDKNGVVYLSWIEKKGKMNFLKYSKLNNDKWSEPIVITSGVGWFVNWADYPMFVSDGDNNLLAHILEKSDSSTYTYDVKLFTSLDNGNSWSDPKILHDDGKKAEHGFVSMAPYGEDYFISWLDGRNTVSENKGGHHDEHSGEMTIRATVINKKGIKSGEWELDKRVCDCCQTSAAITTNGPIVVYRDRSDNEIRDISIVRLINGQWTQPKTVFSDSWEIKGCPVNGPQAHAIDNNLVVAWFSAPDKEARVNLVFSLDGGATFGDAIRIDDGKAIGRVDVVMLDKKSAVVSWMEGSVIKAARVYQHGRKDPSIIIASSSEARSSGFPQMTKYGDNLIFAWSDVKDKIIKVAKLNL